MSTSVCTITRGRDRHLLEQVRRVEASTPPPLEHVVVFMGQRSRPWSVEGGAGAPALVRAIDQDGGVELARARNRAVREARGDILVLLDVDVLPPPDAVAALAAEARAHDALVMAEPRYLSPAWDRVSDPALDALPHPSRSDLGPGPSARYEMFWSLGFAITRGAWERIGGFDEAYVGYGAEDTDFAFRAREASVPLRLSAVPVFHQAHAVVTPPLQHAEAIIANANRFAERWGELPMGGWLDALATLGIVRREGAGAGERVRLLRAPTPAEIEARTLPEARC